MVRRGEGGVPFGDVDVGGAELDVAGLVQHGGPARRRAVGPIAAGRCTVSPSGTASASHGHAAALALRGRLQVHRSSGDAVGEQAEHAVVSVERVVATDGVVRRHGSSTSTMSDTARCTSTSSLTALAMATSHARRGAMPPTTSWAV